MMLSCGFEAAEWLESYTKMRLKAARWGDSARCHAAWTPYVLLRFSIQRTLDPVVCIGTAA
jgi:hypothetical protein